MQATIAQKATGMESLRTLIGSKQWRAFYTTVDRGQQQTIQDTACTSRFEIMDVLVHGTEGRTGSDASPLHGAAQTGTPLRLHGAARMYGCCLTANRTSILQQNLFRRDPNEPASAQPAVRELHSSTDLHGMPDLDHCTELHGTHAAAWQASRGCTSLHGSCHTHRTV